MASFYWMNFSCSWQLYSSQLSFYFWTLLGLLPKMLSLLVSCCEFGSSLVLCFPWVSICPLKSSTKIIYQSLMKPSFSSTHNGSRIKTPRSGLESPWTFVLNSPFQSQWPTPHFHMSASLALSAPDEYSTSLNKGSHLCYLPCFILNCLKIEWVVHHLYSPSSSLLPVKEQQAGQAWWLMPVILATCEAE
jgi:hypothetical protein